MHNSAYNLIVSVATTYLQVALVRAKNRVPWHPLVAARRLGKEPRLEVRV